MKNQKLEYFNVIIATNQYAGNFVHDMGVFITGEAGDVSIEDNCALAFREDSKTMDKAVLVELKKNALVCDGEDSEYEGCECVAEMVDLDDKTIHTESYTGVAIHFKKMPSAKMLEYIKTRSEAFAVHRANVPTRMGDLNPGMQILNVSVQKVVREWRYVIEKTPVEC